MEGGWSEEPGPSDTAKYPCDGGPGLEEADSSPVAVDPPAPSDLQSGPGCSSASFMRPASCPENLRSSFEEFLPDITADEDEETFTFRCSFPGLYRCRETGLLFDMKGGGDVVYSLVPWSRKLLAQHHKKPAGPLFDIKCLKQSMRQLHLPHCEIRSTGGGRHLSVAHVNDEGVEFIRPRQVTETHVIISITGFSGFGNVKDEDSPPDPVQALVLLFYTPPHPPDVISFLKVLLLPRNIVLRDLLRTRKKLVKEERYIDAPPHCKLHPKQLYTLSTAPEDDLVKVQPTEIEFDDESYDSYFTSSQVILKSVLRDISLSLKEATSSQPVWERDVCLFPERPKTLTLPPDEKLLDVRRGFIDRVSVPVLDSLVDKLFEGKVLSDSERESVKEKQSRRDRAGFVIDTVRRKGPAASAEMIDFLHQADLYLCKQLELN
ncbi:NACHT, LRR and PYD domains-containing protein 1-like [Mugil cephalus]|uniref:NACHT, LRR and PYD domains-containing protein 1-like n=1 Tax=Mugil cephalus TaxID=48193 RepID=UPI001FB6A2B6|nr:NACHT, LRR and PYD domains-containing protein 1-like [Mugil cephalus]